MFHTRWALRLAGLLLLGAVAVARAQPPPGRGAGPEQRADMQVFHYLLDRRADITRTVKRLPDGVETLTESDRPEVAKKIQEHAAAMHTRVKEGRGIHLRDPLFRELFRHADRIRMTVEDTPRGVRVKETSADPYTAALIQAHADVVSRFIASGHAEVRINHAVPVRPAPRQ